MKTLQGVVTSLKTDKTARVNVVRKTRHPLYKKYIKINKNYACHVDGIKLECGDRVIIESCKPISKTKHFKVLKKID